MAISIRRKQLISLFFCSLAARLTYEETGRQIFLSLNTVQFHVKNIYGKLLVNKRLQAIGKAREMKLI